MEIGEKRRRIKNEELKEKEHLMQYLLVSLLKHVLCISPEKSSKPMMA